MNKQKNLFKLYFGPSIQLRLNAFRRDSCSDGNDQFVVVDDIDDFTEHPWNDVGFDSLKLLSNFFGFLFSIGQPRSYFLFHLSSFLKQICKNSWTFDLNEIRTRTRMRVRWPQNHHHSINSSFNCSSNKIGYTSPKSLFDFE